MTEKKEFYISPEVEVICFSPIERLAAGDFWTTWGMGTGETPDGVSDTTVETGAATDPTGDVDEGDM